MIQPIFCLSVAVVAVSALTGQLVDGCSAVTGEISVQGKVKPVGGVAAKIEAARKAGLSRVFVPAENAEDCLLAQGIEVVQVADVHQVLTEILLPVTMGEETPVASPAPTNVMQAVENVPLAKAQE